MFLFPHPLCACVCMGAVLGYLVLNSGPSHQVISPALYSFKIWDRVFLSCSDLAWTWSPASASEKAARQVQSCSALWSHSSQGHKNGVTDSGLAVQLSPDSSLIGAGKAQRLIVHPHITGRTGTRLPNTRWTVFPCAYTVSRYGVRAWRQVKAASFLSHAAT